MSHRNLPNAPLLTKPVSMRSEMSPSALERWRPELNAAASDGADNSISILDFIGADFFGEGVTAKRISAALRSIGEKTDVVVNINSPGGDFFEGLAIYNALREHKANVTVNVIGLAASAASVIAMAGDTVNIARAGFLMIHNTWVVAQGDRNALRDTANWLEPFDAASVDIYAARTGLKKVELTAMLDRETWISGQDAVDQGFADSLLPSDAVKEAKASGETAPMLAARKLDAVLARAGIPRSQRRQMIQDLKSGTPGAAAPGDTPRAVADGTLNAAVCAEAARLLAFAKTI